MDCKQLQKTLENLTLPRLQEGKYSALHAHLRGCEICRKLWGEWLREEERIASLLPVEPAPPGLLADVMTGLEKAYAPGDRGDLLPVVTLEFSPRGVWGLMLSEPSLETIEGPHVLPPGVQPELSARAQEQLTEYFRGERAVFRLPVDLSRCTAFQRAVLEAASTIPYGEVRPYKWVAEQIGRPGAWRAVGSALGGNPVPIIVPCHRVIRSDGRAGGYALGSSWKTRLLALERSVAPFVGCGTTHILCYRGCDRERRIGEGNRIHFAYMRDAVESGYRPCKVCRPR